MREEVSSAVKFIADKLRESQRVDDKDIDKFRDCLNEAMLERFQNHWHPDKPLKGNAFRCLNIEDSIPDPLLQEAARKSGLHVDDLILVFPHGLALWVDPNDVACRLGKGSISPIYRRFEKLSPKSSLNVNSPSFTPRQEPKGRPFSPGKVFINGQQARFSPPPGFSGRKSPESHRFTSSGFSEITTAEVTSWGDLPSSIWNDGSRSFDTFENFLTSGFDRRMNFQNVQKNTGWKSNRKVRPGYSQSSNTLTKTADRFNRYHWYREDAITSPNYEVQFELPGIPQEVY